MKKRDVTRRDFLKLAATFTAASALQACTPSTPAPTSPAGVTAPTAAPTTAPAVKEIQPGVPRDQCLILENPSGTVLPADDFNRWRSGYGGFWVGGLQQLALDALWYIDPDAGIDGVWDNALAAEPPIYNEDFTQMTVKLREGIYWSDGVEVTADDLYYTVDLIKNTPGLSNQGLFDGNVDHMEQPDRNTVIFYLKAPNSRFHGAFTVRWGAQYIMPKHIFEQVEDPVAFTFNPPV